jgi:hypothetical protein
MFLKSSSSLIQSGIYLYYTIAKKKIDSALVEFTFLAVDSVSFRLSFFLSFFLGQA